MGRWRRWMPFRLGLRFIVRSRASVDVDADPRTSCRTPAAPFPTAVQQLRALAETRDDAVVRYRRSVDEGIGAAGRSIKLKEQIYPVPNHSTNACTR
jgi:hypothetical protein